jgi:hypothetical protein
MADIVGDDDGISLGASDGEAEGIDDMLGAPVGTSLGEVDG